MPLQIPTKCNYKRLPFVVESNVKQPCHRAFVNLFYNNTKEEGTLATEIFPVPASILKFAEPHCTN